MPPSLPNAAGGQPLRIMSFLHSFEPGGVERVALRLAGAWAAAGFDVRIAMGRRGGALEVERPAGVAFQFAPAFPGVEAFESAWMLAHLARQVRRWRPDVLFCAGNTYVIVAVLLRLLLGRACPPIVCKISNSLVRPDMGWPMRPLYALWLRLQARFIDRFVGMAETMRPEMAAALRLPPQDLAVVHDPALDRGWALRAARLRDAAAQAGPCRRYLAAGRLVPQKNFGLALDAFARVAGPEDRLTILGEGPERARLERRAVELGIADRLSLPGHVADTAPWMAEADALVLSSRYEGVPAVIVEALAAGLPIVATDCCVSMAELLAGGALGRLVPPGDAAALGAAMAAARPGDVAAMRAQADRFTVDRSGSAWLSVLLAAVDDRALARLDARAGSGRSAARTLRLAPTETDAP